MNKLYILYIYFTDIYFINKTFIHINEVLEFIKASFLVIIIVITIITMKATVTMIIIITIIIILVIITVIIIIVIIIFTARTIFTNLLFVIIMLIP